MTKQLIIFNFLLALMSCIEVPKGNNDNYVVEGYVYSGERVRNIAVKTLISLDDPSGESIAIENASVVLLKSGQEYNLDYNSQTKFYEYLSNDLTIQSLDELMLEVNVNSRVSTAISVVPTPPVGMVLSKPAMVIPKINSGIDFIGNNPLEDAEITLTWDNPKHELHYVVIEFRSNLLRPILPADVQEVVDGIIEDFAIISAPDTISTYEIQGALLPSYGPYIVKIYKVNQEYADLYQSDTQDSRELNDPPSNITNARGIFTAFASDSLSFDVILP